MPGVHVIPLISVYYGAGLDCTLLTTYTGSNMYRCNDYKMTENHTHIQTHTHTQAQTHAHTGYFQGKY